MVKHYHKDIEVDWTDREWDRLQRIKQGEDVPYGQSRKLIGVQSNLSPLLKTKAEEFAKANGMSLSKLIRETLKIIVD